MEPSTRISVPSPQSSVTGHYRRNSLLNTSYEEVNSNRQSEVLLHGNEGESFHNAVTGTSLHRERRGHDQGRDSLASTEHSSFKSDLTNPTMVHDDSVTPRPDCGTSSARLTTKQEGRSKFFRNRQTYLLWIWKWEALSIITSLGLLAAIVATLGKYNRETPPEWPYNININSLISLFTTVMIAQLGFILAEIISQLKWLWLHRPHPLQDLEHYDAASRGMMGAALFLGRFIWQPRAYLAVGAAFTLLVSAAIGPFTQQSIKSYTCQRPLNNMSASIAVASWVDDSHVSIGPADPSLDAKMASTVFEGVFGSKEESPTVPFNCTTGNCDFPHYSSIGYCSSCVDVTSHVQEQYEPLPPYPYTSKWSYRIPDEQCSLGFTTKEVPRFNSTAMRTEYNNPAQLTFCPSPLNDNDVNEEHNFTTSFLIWDCNPSLNKSSDNSFCGLRPGQLPILISSSRLVALKCTLGVCVRDYISRVRNGVLDETITDSSSSNYQLQHYESTILKLPCPVDWKYYDISNISQVPSIPGRNFTTLVFDGQNVTVPLECVFKIKRTALYDIMAFLETEIFQSPRSGQDANCRTGSHNTSHCSPWYLASMYRNGRVTAETISSDMDRISVAISNRMRAVGMNAYRNGSGIAPGAAIQTTVCVHVEWPWLLFPGVLVLVTVLLFVCVLLMARTIHKEQPNWKSSALVGFFHRVDVGSHTAELIDGGTASRVAPAHWKANSRAPSSSLRQEGESDLMSLESMHEKARKVVVSLETAATRQRGFLVVDEEEVRPRINTTQHEGGRESTESHGDGEALPLTHRLQSNGNLGGQRPAYLHVDLGTGLSSSIRSSLNGSTQYDLEGSPEREAWA